MGEIFTQRRILGLLTLALACLITGGWLRTIANRRIPEFARWREPYTYDYEVTCIPLTLASAYLLIIKPRKRKQKKLVASTSDRASQHSQDTSAESTRTQSNWPSQREAHARLLRCHAAVHRNTPKES
jgi:hypothetical protein